MFHGNLPWPAKDLLKNVLAGNGVEVTSTAERLKSYLDVENTYLATFQALGGLGLLLGTLGLAVVLLRSVWERRGELALLRALGYRHSALGWLVLAENGWLACARPVNRNGCRPVRRRPSPGQRCRRGAVGAIAWHAGRVMSVGLFTVCLAMVTSLPGAAGASTPA